MDEAVAQPRWAMCLGGADCVWDDVLAWEQEYGRQWDGVVIAANDVGAHWPRPLHHWASLHHEKFPRWAALRAKQGFSPITHDYWASDLRGRPLPEGTMATRRLKPWSGGSSGMLTVQVALALGCTHAVLCGIPLTATPHFAETVEVFHQQWVAANGHWKAWPRHREQMQGWVKSMSGRTRELLGAPSREWLLSGPHRAANVSSIPGGADE